MKDNVNASKKREIINENAFRTCLAFWREIANKTGAAVMLCITEDEIPPHLRDEFIPHDISGAIVIEPESKKE